MYFPSLYIKFGHKVLHNIKHTVARRERISSLVPEASKTIALFYPFTKCTLVIAISCKKATRDNPFINNIKSCNITQRHHNYHNEKVAKCGFCRQQSQVSIKQSFTSARDLRLLYYYYQGTTCAAPRAMRLLHRGPKRQLDVEPPPPPPPPPACLLTTKHNILQVVHVLEQYIIHVVQRPLLFK